MQRHIDNVDCTIGTIAREPARDHRLLLLRKPQGDCEASLAAARAALAQTAPGAMLLDLDDQRLDLAGAPGHAPALHLLGAALSWRDLRSIPAHPVFGDIVLQLMAEGVPPDAFNTLPADLPERNRVLAKDDGLLLLVLPSETAVPLHRRMH